METTGITFMGMKEYSQKVKHSCGHVQTVVTLGYVPELDKRLVCPSCYRKYLLGELAIPPETARLHSEKNTRVLMSWISQDKHGDLSPELCGEGATANG